MYMYIYIVHMYITNMLRPLRKENAKTCWVLNKALKTEAYSLLCKLYIYE